MNRTNETWGIQYPGDFFPAMIKISPITHHPAVAVSWCSADASAGSSSVSPGTQIWVFIQLWISMKLVQTELGSMSQAARKGTGWAQHPISFVSTARLGQQQQSALKKAIQNPNVLGRATNVGCLLLLYCYLVASCRQKRQSFLKKEFSAHQPHQLSVLPISWGVNGFQVPPACL